jgi:hypothetical protein
MVGSVTWTGSLVPIGDPTSGEVVRGQFHLDLVAREDSDVVHPHLPGDVREHLVSIVEFDLEHGVRQRFEDLALEYDRIFLWLGQGILLTWSCSSPLQRPLVPAMGSVFAVLTVSDRAAWLDLACGQAGNRC